MGRAIDADAMENDLREQYEKVFVEAGRKVKPEDYFIERNAVYNADRIKAEFDSFFEYLASRPTIEPKQEWISAKDRLPKGRREYLCICKFGENSEYRYYNILMFHPEKEGDNGFVKGPHFSDEGMNDMRVTHWMPLPKMPAITKGEKENE